MDYEKKYNEVLSHARQAYGTGAYDDLTLEAIFPELAESEDERIRKEIVSALKFANDGGVYDKHIAYLEKQKDVTAVRNVQEAYRKGLDYAIEVVKQKPEKYGLQKDVKVKYVYPKFRIGDIISNNKPEPGSINDYTIVGFNNEMPDYLVDGGNVPSCSIGIEFIDNNYHLKEEKPVDLSEIMVHKEPYIAPVPTPMVADEQKPVEPSGKLSRQDYLYQLLIDQLITYSDYEYLTGKKPAEWSDEDERIRNQLIYDVEYHKKKGLISAKQNKATKALYNGIEECYDEKIAWLKSLPERFVLQPKPEWSEEDEEISNNILNLICSQITYVTGQGTMSGKQYPTYTKERDWFMNRLKSLRAQWKPSEKQMKALQSAIDACESEWAYQDDELRSLFADLQKLM